MITSRIAAGSRRDAPVGAAARTEGDAQATAFGVTLAGAMNARGDERSGNPASDRHTVKAGETLYGIAHARLTSAGQPATPNATMRYAMHLAATNQIRNPDLILVGQRLELGHIPRAQAHAPGSIDASARPIELAAAAIPEADEIPTPVEDDNSTQVGSSPTQAEASEGTRPLLERIASVATLAMPEPATAIRAPEVSVDRTPAARSALALYEQTAPVLPKPRDELPDIVYKGVVGKALDMMPLEPSTRTGLQQANAVVSGSLVGRSIAALTGLGGPLLTLAGLAWGLFSAHKIAAAQPPEAGQVARTTVADAGK